MLAYIVAGIITGLNYVIEGIAAAIVWALSQLPDMPDPPDWSGVPTQVFGIVNWLFPLGFLVSAIGALFVLWIAWQIVSILLRWGKAI